MTGDIFQIITAQYQNGYNGNALLIDMKKLNNEYNYIGLWYAHDANEKTQITTEFYYANSETPVLPEKFSMELKENTFKQTNRFELPKKYNWIWIATRIDNNRYCDLKKGDIKEGKLYVNYKILHHKSFGFDVLGNGIFKGGRASFFPLGSEDNTGDIDYKDAYMYLVMIQGYPPPDWNIDPASIGIENVPVFAQTFKFADNRKYSAWFGQEPLGKVK